jgi:hypothetical protein
MTTANELISQALGLLGIRSAGNPVGGAEAAIALERLNTMVDAWRINSLFAYATATVTGTLPANTTTRTVGPAAQLVTAPRPMRIEAGSKFTAGGIDYPILPVTQAEFELIGIKALASIGPEVVFYNPTLPTGLLSFYPQASAAVTLSLVVLQQVSEFADLTTDYTLAPGTRRALVFSLAEEAAADFEREVPPSVARTARNARRAVHIANHSVPQLMPEVQSGPLLRLLEG